MYEFTILSSGLPYHTIMINFIENVLCLFESCFSRKAAFRWFVTITIGLMLRSDKLGITSVIRDLALCHGCYDSMIPGVLMVFRAQLPAVSVGFSILIEQGRAFPLLD